MARRDNGGGVFHITDNGATATDHAAVQRDRSNNGKSVQISLALILLIVRRWLSTAVNARRSSSRQAASVCADNIPTALSNNVSSTCRDDIASALRDNISAALR